MCSQHHNGHHNHMDGLHRKNFGRLDYATGYQTAEEIDEKREENIAYEYLCHLEEAKIWIESVIKEKLPATVDLEEELRNGVILAKLGHFIAPNIVPIKRIYDNNLERYKSNGLHFRHTDNINHWIRSLMEIKLPRIFYPETTDIYDRKNIPRLIYCIHALSIYLHRLGKAPLIQNLYGSAQFTDEEISNMSKVLEKYGISMPSFSKIGGILANELPLDEAELHAAIVAINGAIDSNEPVATLNALHLQSARIHNLTDDLILDYQMALLNAKLDKMDVFRNKSPDAHYVPDFYDELLTRSEIQNIINEANVMRALTIVNAHIEMGNLNFLRDSLHSPILSLKDIRLDLMDSYLQNFRFTKKAKCEGSILNIEELQCAISYVNSTSGPQMIKKMFLLNVNRCLEDDNAIATFKLITDPSLNLPSVKSSATALYHQELKLMRLEKQEDLDFDEISDALNVLNAIVRINEAIQLRNDQLLMSAILDSDAHIEEVDPTLQHAYLEALLEAKENEEIQMLTHYQINLVINEVNEINDQDSQKMAAVYKINDALASEDVKRTMLALTDQKSHIVNVNEEFGDLYHALLSRARLEKMQETNDDEAKLLHEEIQEGVVLSNQNALFAKEISLRMSEVNKSVIVKDTTALASLLNDSTLEIDDWDYDFIEHYMDRLHQFREQKSSMGNMGSGWMMNKLSDDLRIFFNVHTNRLAFSRNSDIKKDYSLLTRDDVLKCILEVNEARKNYNEIGWYEDFVVALQSVIRGYIARKKFVRNLAALKIQSWWRMASCRKEYLQNLQAYKIIAKYVIKIQAAVRMYITRKNYLDWLDYYKQYEDQIVKIQTFVRSAWARQDYQNLLNGNTASVGVIRKFIHLLDINNKDYQEEIEVDELRKQVVQDIRTNQTMEKNLNQMDLLIGLLIKNRITLQEVITEQDKATKRATLGLKALSKESHDRLEAYQHLFYLLQTKPIYLARLLFEMSQARTTKFMDSGIFTLYNYAENDRDEYLFLKLLRTALQCEIDIKVNNLSDLATGNPMVVKMILTFNRKPKSRNGLKEMLRPLIENIINSDLEINTNVLEIHKQWLNQMESETGKKSGMSYNVTVEEALMLEPVRLKFEKAVDSLKQATEMFFSTILKNVDKVPYCMRYMAKVAKFSLEKRFPNTPEKEILKIIGNLVYYRYINPVIVAPDVFDIIDAPATKALTAEHRRNLGYIAKILQFAALNKGYGADCKHLTIINKYIMDAHVRFKNYFSMVCDVEEPEVRFGRDKYSEAILLTKPVIYISVEEIVDIHKLLLEQCNNIAPDKDDPLHELLNDLGPWKDIDGLVDSPVPLDEAQRSAIAKTMIYLALSDKFDIMEEDFSESNALMLRTKQLVMDLIRCQKSGDSLRQILNRNSTTEEEDVHQALLKERVKNERRNLLNVTQTKLTKYISTFGDEVFSLDQKRNIIKENLSRLEELGLVTRNNDYADLIKSIIQDVQNQRLYRQKRRQEAQRLKQTLKNLADKRLFYEDQNNYYNQYVQTCLAQTNKANNNNKSNNKEFKKQTVKYTALKLYEKGVLLRIDGIQQNQLRNITFEISTTEVPGTFYIISRFLEANCQTAKIHFENLLELQYEGKSVHRLFNTVQVNINLLIFLLNKKFYRKN